MKVCVIGTGYVGLVSGVCFSEFGVVVTCVDKDREKIASLCAGRSPIYEAGLNHLIEQNLAGGRLFFMTELASAVSEADIVFIAVGTPPRVEDGHADLSSVYAVAQELAPHLKGYTVIAVKSTVPVGTCDEVEALILNQAPDADFDVVSNPEFLREGAAVNDFMNPDRVIVGTESLRARDLLGRLYKPLYLAERPVLFTSRRTSELIKYASNSFLATKITFINELADLCERIGGDIQDVSKGMGLDKRIGKAFLNPGPGYGGSCFPKDTLALVKTAHEADYSMRIVESVIEVNDCRKKEMAARIIKACGGSVEGKSLAVLGLTFKPETDDMRDSPSLDIIPALASAGGYIKAFDPYGIENAQALLSGDICYCESVKDAILDSDAVIIITDWNQFRNIDLDWMRTLMSGSTVIDLRNLYTPDDMMRAGFHYVFYRAFYSRERG